jgi:enoyl-CoA hydratase/carnithine racemase
MTAHAQVLPPSSPPLLREDAEGVTTLVLDRPGARNALSDGLIAALDGALRAIEADASVRAVVLAAEGPAFCAGHDLKEMTAWREAPDGGADAFAGLFARCSALMQRIVALPQPVIAAVEGVATAAGCQLVASCDLAVAGANARFATPGVQIGLFCSTPMVALSRAVPRKAAMRMLLTGELVGAQEALGLGLVSHVAPAGGARAAALEIARGIAGRSALTVRVGKRAFHEQAEMTLADAYAHASRVMADNMMARDANEGICAFIERREPAWKDG